MRLSTTAVNGEAFGVGESPESSQDTLPLSVLASPSFTPSISRDGSDDLDGDSQDPSAPLLPQYRSSSPPPAHKANDRRFLVVALVVAGFSLLAFAGGVHFLFRPRSPTVALSSTSSAPLDILNSDAVTTDDPLTSSHDFLLNTSSSNKGVLPFSSSSFSSLYRPAPLQHPLSTLSWPSAACLEQYVATGSLCSASRRHWVGESAPKVDVVWTWVNGSSEEVMADWRMKVSDEVGQFAKVKGRLVKFFKGVWKRAAGASVRKHFRYVSFVSFLSARLLTRASFPFFTFLSSEHDELRYSIRSIIASLPASTLSTLHLVVGDTPAYSPYSPPSSSNTTVDPLTTCLAQIPYWVDLPAVDFAESGTEERRGKPQLVIHPHSQLFKTPESSGDVKVAEAEAKTWQEGVLPSFNRSVCYLPISSEQRLTFSLAVSPSKVNSPTSKMSPRPLSTSTTTSSSCR
jgi:hypothetical protein